MRTVLIITSSQPSTNPRAVKEAISLIENNFKVYFVYNITTPWASFLDQQILLKYPKINWINSAGSYNQNRLLQIYYRLRRKFYSTLYLIFNLNYFLDRSLILFMQELYKVALTLHFDLIIAHNLGTLPVAVKLSKALSKPIIFDFEDFHRGEFDLNSIESKKVIKIEDANIKSVLSLTSASPEISEHYSKLFNKKVLTVNNVFQSFYAIDKVVSLPKLPLKLFWFSQCIGKKRGLETIIEAMSYFSSNEITLTLLGSSSTLTKTYFYDIMELHNLNTEQIIFMNPVSEKEIVFVASQHHIGLASEYSHNLNRDLCLTNKIFMYLLAGNAVILSDTLSQKSFLGENPGIGSIYGQNNVHELTSVLKSYLNDAELLQLHRQNALDLSRTKYNWDIEKHQFLANVKSVLGS